MKKNLIAAAVLLAFALSAQASNLFGNTTNNNQTYNQPAAHATGGQGGAGGQGGEGGTGVGLAIAGAASAAEAKANAAAMANQAQGQQQGQNQTAVAAQGQQQSNSNTVRSTNDNSNAVSNSVTVEGSTYEAQKRDPVSTAYAASIAPTAPCMGSTSGGLQGVGFGVSFGGTWTDDNCVLLEQIRATKNIGDNETALEMMMDIPSYAAARKRIADRKAK